MKREYMFNTEKAGSEKVLALYLALDMILRFRSLYLRKKKKMQLAFSTAVGWCNAKCAE